MKKGTGFEKFYKGKEKTGGAKKEEIRKEKRQLRKEREDEIAAHKRQKRAQAKGAQTAWPQRSGKPDAGFGKKDKPAKTGSFGEDRRKPGATGEKRFGKPQRTEGGYKPEKRDGQPRADNNRFEHKAKSFDQKQKRSPKGANNGDRNRPSGGNRPRDERYAAKPAGKAPQKFGNRPEKNKPSFAQQRKQEKPFVLQDVKPNKEKPALQAPASSSGKPVLKKNPAATPEDQMPLNKYIAHSGVCSRRDAVDLIKSGKVKVNGELILEPGHKVLVSDDVKVAGKKLNPVRDFVYILLNKPKDYITTTDDPQERKTVLDLLQNAPPARIYPVGRLDRNTSGVLLLTNDGDLSQQLTHPSNEVKKVYAVTLDKPLTRNHFEEILRGVELEDGPASVDMLAYTDAKDHTQIGVELHSGRNRIVRRIFEHLGYDVKALDRVTFAGLTKKNVNRGKWRLLTDREVRDLKFFKKGRK